jgi:hypothetical protein
MCVARPTSLAKVPPLLLLLLLLRLLLLLLLLRLLFLLLPNVVVQVAALVAALRDAVSVVGATAAAPEAASCSLKDFLGRPVPQVHFDPFIGV